MLCLRIAHISFSYVFVLSIKFVIIDCNAMKQALFKLVDRCFTSVHHDAGHQLDNTGLDLCTPVTLIHLLLNMKSKILGGSMLI